MDADREADRSVGHMIDWLRVILQDLCEYSEDQYLRLGHGSFTDNVRPIFVCAEKLEQALADHTAYMLLTGTMHEKVTGSFREFTQQAEDTPVIAIEGYPVGGVEKVPDKIL
jgi:hypothetical protein